MVSGPMAKHRRWKIPNCANVVVTLQVDVGIDFVSDAIVALVAFKPDVMSGRAYPQRFSLDLKRSLPNAQMVARFCDVKRLRVRPAGVLRPSEEVELAHGHGQIGLFRNTFDDAFQHRLFHVGIHFYPASGSKSLLHSRFRAEE